MKKIFLIAIILTLYQTSYAQFTEFHPELNWYTIKGEHVQVHYHEGAERTARVVCKIADEVWGPITSLYQYEPETVHFVIKDIDDYSNGATYFFDNKIEIWASALDFDLRGTHNWLRNVITHEFTHIVQIQASLKVTRRIPAVYLQWLNYADERNPRILYGYPNVIVSYPLAFVNIPPWLAEGTAQYQRSDFDYENWDTHRDMVLRSYALDGNMLTWNQMGVFEKTSLGNESVYNSGFALVRYISQKYGEDKLRAISYKLGKFTNFTVDAAFSDVLGKSGIEIYNEWKNFLTKDYSERTAKVKENLVIGDTIASVGFGNFYPIFSSDGSKVLYTSNKTADYFNPSSVYLYDLKTKEEKLILPGVHSTISWIPNANKIVYAKISEDNPNWANIHDLYVYDIDKDEETRLTYNVRANQPQVSNDGKSVVFLFEKDGTANLGLIDIDGKNFRQLTFFSNGEQVYNPKFSNDDTFIVFDYSLRLTRDVARVNVDGSNFQYILQKEEDDRNPVFDKDGNLIYASDKTGIFNLYKLNLQTKEEKQLTNVTGGAFMPAVDKDGNIVYAGYISSGYKIFYLKKEDQNKVVAGHDYIRRKNPPLDETKPNGDINKFNLSGLRNYDDTKTPDYKPEKYSGAFSNLTFFPFIRYDNYNTSNKFYEKIKPGLYVTSSDMLNRYDIFAGASINTRWERDLFFSFDFRNKLPGLFQLGLKPELSLDIYNVSRVANVNIDFEGFAPIPDNVTYSLFEVDLAAKHRIIARGSELELRYIYSRYTAMLDNFIFPDSDILYPATDDIYLIGSNFQVKYNYDVNPPRIDDEINPFGSSLEIKYNYQINLFNPDGNYSIVNGSLQPVYNYYRFHSLELNTQYHFPLFETHTLTLKLRGGGIFGHTVPDFFDFFLGGLVGMKEYPFYAIEGNKVFWINLTYRFPLYKNIDARIGHLYVDKIFFSFFGDLGNAWNGNSIHFRDLSKGAGAELRIAMNSFYMFPTSVFFDASYGFNKYNKVIDNNIITYGHEWRFYAGVLFGFDI